MIGVLRAGRSRAVRYESEASDLTPRSRPG